MRLQTDGVAVVAVLQVGDTHNNMAVVYGKQGKMAKALKHHRKALAVGLAALGKTMLRPRNLD